MNIICIPYHDWRKILNEGFRTRDAHFIETLRSNSNVEKLIIINRPYSLLEYVLKYRFKKIKGEIIYQKGLGKLISIGQDTYLLDYKYNYSISQIFEGRKWFIKKYKEQTFHNFVSCSIEKLNIRTNLYTINFNIFAAGLNKIPNSKKTLFDAWDNFEKFPNLQSIVVEIEKCYKEHTKTADYWSTNSLSNISFFSKKYFKENIKFIPNGVDFEKINKNRELSKKLKHISGPLIGFGGKFTHLVDVELVNYLVKENKDFSFVFMGQILDKSVFKSINKESNFFYLGDLHYDEYINTLPSLDVCIIPYVVKEKETGANTIKLYEYLAAKKQVISTRGNGVEPFSDYIFIADNYEDFSNSLKLALLKPKDPMNEKLLNKYSWKSLCEGLLNIFENK